MIKVFTPEECCEIFDLSSIYHDYHLRHSNRIKSHVISYLQSHHIIMSDLASTKMLIHTSSNHSAKEWHYDDVLIINFIINIQGEGTKILINGHIETLPKGYGCIMIGEKGYTFLGLKPVLHCAPPIDTNRCIIKFLVLANFHVPRDFIGPSVCKYQSDEYNKRYHELNGLFKEDLQIIQST